MKRILLSLLFTFLALSRSLALDVRDFGALGDGRHIDSPAINAAIEQVAKEGGGTIVLTEGVYPCYSVHLKSNMTKSTFEGSST